MQDDDDSDLDYPVLGRASMDSAHRVLLDRMTELAQASDQEFVGAYPSLVAAIERDFREEEALMEAVGLASFQTHLEQHARMLSALHHAASHVQEGDVMPGREVFMLLPEWLSFHIATLDQALADVIQ